MTRRDVSTTPLLDISEPGSFPVPKGDFNDLHTAADDVVGKTRVARTRFRAHLASSQSYTSPNAAFARGGWVIDKDTDTAGHAGSTSTNDLCSWTCPQAGRLWDIAFHFVVTAGSSSQTAHAYVTRGGSVSSNTVSVSTYGIVSGNTGYLGNQGDVHVWAQRFDVPLAAGDVLRWAWACSTNTTIQPAAYGHPTEIVIRDAGAA